MKKIVFCLLTLLGCFVGVKADVVEDLFPWFEIGETVDAAKEKGLKHLNDFAAKPDLRAHSQYYIRDTGFPTNHAAWVILSIPDRKVLELRHDIECATTNEAAKLSAELIEKLKPLEAKDGKRLIEVCPTSSDATVCVILYDADYGREYRAWWKRVTE